MFDFKEWLRLDEQPHFSVGDRMVIPCKNLVKAGLTLPCKAGTEVGGIDMRFEFYPKNSVFAKMGPFDKFIAPIPGSHNYIAYDVGAKMVPFATAMKKGYLPADRTGRFVHQPGEKSQAGYVLMPDDWIKYARLLDQDYNFIKE